MRLKKLDLYDVGQTLRKAIEPEMQKLEQAISSTSDDRTANNVMRHEYRVLSDEEKKKAMQHIKDAGAKFIFSLDLYVHDGREKSLAVTKIEEAVMWAVKGITK